MAPVLISILVVLGVAYRVTTPEERARFFNGVLGIARQLLAAEARRQEALVPFRAALRERTRWLVATPLILAANMAVFAEVAAHTGSPTDPDTLVAWGASFGPRTLNGEWWRLLSSPWVHSTAMHLVMNGIGLLQIGSLAERVLGPLAMLAVYISAGLLATATSLVQHPMTVSWGASGAVSGIYGAVLVTAVAGRFQSSAVGIPLRALKGVAPAAVAFLLYVLSADAVDAAGAGAGMLAGVAAGLVLNLGTGGHKPPLGRVAIAFAGAIAIAVATSLPLRGIIDVRPELARIVAIEEQTAREYWAAVERFKERKMSPEALAQLIDGTIRPKLAAAREQLSALSGVTEEQQILVAAAHQYCRLREESWRLRAEGLRRTDMLRLRQAESAERGSLEALQHIRER